jgi:DNA ligase 1
VPAQNRVDRLVTSDPAAAGDFLDATLAAGHEGVMAKSLTASYEAGRRGAGWLKVKPVHTLDLVVLASSGGRGGAEGSCPIFIWAPATRPPAASPCWARPSRA